MYKEIYDLVSKYNDNKEIVDAKFISSVCEIIRDTREMGDFVKSWSFNESMNNIATYNTKYNLIEFRPTILDPTNVKGRFPDMYHLLYNFRYIQSIFHEFAHARQVKDCYHYTFSDNSDELFVILFYLSSKKFCKYQFFPLNIPEYFNLAYYHRHHDNDPMERDAILTALNDQIEVAKYLPQDDESSKNCFDNIQKECADFKLNGYELLTETTNNPTLEYLKRMPITLNSFYIWRWRNKLTNMNVSYEERLQYGLALKQDEYIKLLVKRYPNI